MPTAWTNTQVVNNLLREGLSWSGATVTYGFPNTKPNWSLSSSEGSGFSALSSAQIEMAKLTVSLWDDLIATDFVETSASPQISFQNSTTGVGYAHAYMPGGWSGAGSIWFNPNFNSGSGTNDLVTPKLGQWGALVYIHEMGHALGLDHPGHYNGGNPVYANDALYAQDSIMYTIMSYFDADNTGADWVASNGKMYYAQTPMLHDILAIQALYGVETNTRTGDTRYGFNSNTNNIIFDFSQNLHPILTIWDSGGNDWLDLSGFATASRIDLNQGAFSDCDGMTKNIAIAFNCDIENAAGGAGNDRITGNALNNTLVGNGGNDILTGGAGIDILVGGEGNDTFYADALDDLVQFSGGTGYDVLYVTGTLTYTFNYLVYGFEEMWLTESVVEGDISGTENPETLNGTENSETISGLGGNDIIYGNGGDDVLSGGAGNDKLNGGLGTDTANYAGASMGVKVSLLLNSAQNTIGAGSDTLTGIENLTGSSFNDKLTGSAVANLIKGQDGDDVLDGKTGADILEGGNGNDTYIVDHLGDVVDETGGAGLDTVQSSVSFSLANSASTMGTVENLTLTGTGNINGTGNETENVLNGNRGSNVLDGGDGVDTVSYASARGAVSVNLSVTLAQYTGSAGGTDTLLNLENLTGSVYGDRLTGSHESNRLLGLAGGDIISAGGGEDVLIGGSGKDTLTGGADADSFVFLKASDSAAGRNRDVITDFTIGADKIDLSAIDAISGGEDDAFTLLQTAAFSGQAGQLIFMVNGGQTIVAGDLNGNKVADFQIALTGVHALSLSDFVL